MRIALLGCFVVAVAIGCGGSSPKPNASDQPSSMPAKDAAGKAEIPAKPTLKVPAP